MSQCAWQVRLEQLRASSSLSVESIRPNQPDKTVEGAMFKTLTDQQLGGLRMLAAEIIRLGENIQTRNAQVILNHIDQELAARTKHGTQEYPQVHGEEEARVCQLHD